MTADPSRAVVALVGCGRVVIEQWAVAESWVVAESLGRSPTVDLAGFACIDRSS